MKRSLRILGLADIHDQIEMIDTMRDATADLIAFCGDLHDDSSYSDAKPAAVALAKFGMPILIVPGNNDHKDVVRRLWKEAGFIIMHRSSFQYGNCGFLGMGGMEMRNSNVIRESANYYHQDEEVYDSLAMGYQEISGSSKTIVLTHQPPRGARDTVYNGKSTGSISLYRFVKEFQPELLLCGHIHESRGEAWIGRTKIINVGEGRRGYAVLIELNDEIGVDWIEP